MAKVFLITVVRVIPDIPDPKCKSEIYKKVEEYCKAKRLFWASYPHGIEIDVGCLSKEEAQQVAAEIEALLNK